jgi:hypothetical protein
MAGVRFTDVQARPTEFLDLTSVTLDEFQQLVPPFEDTAGEVGDMGDCTPGVSMRPRLRYTIRACRRPDTALSLYRSPRRLPCCVHLLSIH